MVNGELTNPVLKRYKDECKRLTAEIERLELYKEAILSKASQVIDSVANVRRLDYGNLTNAFSAYQNNELDSIHFTVVDTSIRNLFNLPENEFEFVSVTHHEYTNRAYAFTYKKNDVTIEIKIPSDSNMDETFITDSDWGMITAYVVNRISESEVEKIMIAKSDDYEIIANAIGDYFKEDSTSDVEED